MPLCHVFVVPRVYDEVAYTFLTKIDLLAVPGLGMQIVLLGPKDSIEMNVIQVAHIVSTVVGEESHVEVTSTFSHHVPPVKSDRNIEQLEAQLAGFPVARVAQSARRTRVVLPSPRT